MDVRLCSSEYVRAEVDGVADLVTLRVTTVLVTSNVAVTRADTDFAVAVMSAEGDSDIVTASDRLTVAETSATEAVCAARATSALSVPERVLLPLNDWEAS